MKLYRIKKTVNIRTTFGDDSIPIWKEGNVDVCENDHHHSNYLGLGHSAVPSFLHIEIEFFCAVTFL